jgi:hypothetical protein
MPIDKYFEGHGEEVMASMKKTYANKGGAKKAKSVFYALSNKKKKKQKASQQADALEG